MVNLSLDETGLAVCRMDAKAEFPAWALQATPLHLSRTSNEVSIVVPESCIPQNFPGITVEGDWVAMTVEGPLDFSLTGILSSLALPLAKVGVSIFAISTYDTDIILIKRPSVDAAVAALNGAGHVVARA